MLEHVKSMLHERTMPFDEYYMMYCMRVQDDNIENEAIFRLKHTSITSESLNQIERAISSEQGKLVTQ